jgi:hypothetical protein
MCCVLALAAFIFAVEFGLNRARGRFALSRSWKVTTGTVFARDLRNHLSISVRYSVEGRFVEQTYEGSEKNVGDAVLVYYSPKDATLSDIRNPADSLRRDLQLFLAACVVLGTFASIFITFPAIGQALAWPLAKFQVKPRFVTTWVAVAVFIGTASNLILQRSDWWLWLADALVVGGTTLLCIRAFRLALDDPWGVYLKSRTFVIGGLLVLVGQIVGWGQWR